MSNKQQDANAICKLQELNWKVITIFECDLKSKNHYITLSQLLNILTNDHTDMHTR